MNNRVYLSIPIAVSLVATLLAMSALIRLASAPQQEFQTHVAGISQRLGYDLHWVDRLQPGQSLTLVKDQRMISGHERVWVALDGEMLGFLPEFAGGQQVREAWRLGLQARAEIVEIDPLDPARGVVTRVRISG